jgi:predicted ribosomally synthesized peptide with SipW-like signal peptide
MTERNHLNVTRRRVLGSVGAVGVASVGAGLGTSAYFSDGETYEGNRLVAGELDLQVDWEEHYSDWSDDESEGLQNPVVMEDPNDGDYVGVPDPANPLVYVHRSDLGQFTANTSVEAYPDEDDDRSQDLILTRNQLSTQLTGASPEEVETAFRNQFADAPAGLDSDLRTESSRGEPLIRISDVKPGDFGEVTFSLHLFDNPGYVWLTGALVENAENGHTEPEAEDPDEDAVAGDTEGELPEAIRVLVWHDDGDNVLGETELVTAPHNVEEPTAVALSREQATITEGTLGEFLEEVADGGIALDANTTTTGRDCYPYSTTRHVCLAWWLPVDHANEIQTDSVSFDLGFYTEQCRHNDGSGGSPDG